MTPQLKQITVSPTISTSSLMEELKKAYSEHNKYLLVSLAGYDIDITDAALARYLDAAMTSNAQIAYSDYRVRLSDGKLVNHPLAPYQFGSVRDDFDLGTAFILKIADIYESFWGDIGACESDYSGLYALRLALVALRSTSPYDGASAACHIPEALYVSSETDTRSSGEKQFDYVDPRNRSVQLDREKVCRHFLDVTGALLKPEKEDVSLSDGNFPVEASVIIPVRDRARTIAEAVESALSQKADFPFNVIVVDNHSTDGTTEILQEIAAREPRLVHIMPERDDLGIGGCWDMAIRAPRCGRFAVQLDSDDKYKDDSTLRKIVEKFYEDNCAMVIGSYELTDFDGNPIPPGLIDHKEWTAENGANNALRINGLGAPRAFFTPILREIGVPNVSYGEDYALGLRIGRDWRIGRIYESLYLCRRWGGNSDANLSQERVNTNNVYKDWLRTIEIAARKKKNTDRLIALCDEDEDTEYRRSFE